ncbi:MAG: glycosyltransferase family 2 protein [Crocinitomicaceae bacterium]|nr:glycosyltransferase family 2 protein [Crocinitomicaceae bacterium]
MIIRVIIPAYNEELSIGKVIQEIPKDLVKEVIVCNNNSSDQTEKEANNAGVTVLNEPLMGYGYACLRGIQYINQNYPETDIVVFLDGDYSDYPEQMVEVVRPILEEDMDLVIGSRALGNQEEGSMTIPQRFGNWLSGKLLKWIYKANFTDLGPFRAIKLSSLNKIQMQDKTYGWTVEMQVKVAQHKMKFCEVPVDYKKRIGVSKVSGTVKGAFMAGIKILYTIMKYARK